MFRISIAQLNPVVGAFEANFKKIKEAYERACAERARLLLTPELGICGYPAYDLIDRPEIFERNERCLEDLTRLTQGQSCALAVGYVGRNPQDFGKLAQNTVSILEKGNCVFTQAKTLLPTYDVFDEARYFEPAPEIKLWNCDGYRIAMAICEDLWGEDLQFHHRLYNRDPVKAYESLGAQLVCSMSASPYFWGKFEKRQKVHQEIAKRLKVPLVYLNQVGATDEVLFDGGSFALDSNGNLAGRLPFFKTSHGVVSLKLGELDSKGSEVVFESSVAEEGKGALSQESDEIATLHEGLVTGIREYFLRTGFKKAILGLSGGIDSAVVAALAVQALGAENVVGVGMPSQYSSADSLEDAEILAKNLGMSFQVKPIKFLFSTASRELSELRGQLTPVAAENLQARLRGIILMTWSNHDGALVLTTGNKSELAMGYCTLYGDMAGALAPIGDLFKTRVYQLANFINRKQGNPIPPRTISKAPSAELRPNQKDEDTLPPYEVLDELLEAYLEKGVSVDELTATFSEKSLGKLKTVQNILKVLEINEYKRKQSAQILKVSPKAFGIGRRIPIAKKWDQ